MALQKLAYCIAELNRRMKASAMAELLLQDGVLSVAEYSQLSATVDRSGEIAGNRSLTCLLLGKSEAELSLFLCHLRDLHSDLADLFGELPHVNGEGEAKDPKLAGGLAGSLNAAPSTTDGRGAELQALRAEREASAAERDSAVATITADRDAIAAERDALAAERDALLTTVAECASTEYERAPTAVQRSVRNVFRLRHTAILADYPRRPLPKWRTVGSIPANVERCTPCVFRGHMYLSVVRNASEQAILRNPLNALNRPWSEMPLPPVPGGKIWERVRVFSSETVLYCRATTDYKSVPVAIFEHRDGVWIKVTQLHAVRRDAGFGTCDDAIVLAGGHDGMPCLEISMFPTGGEPGMRKWRPIGKLDRLRIQPHILSQGKTLHVVGGTGYINDSLTSVLTLTPALDGMQQSLAYTQTSSAVAAAVLREVGAVIVRDRIVSAGGWQQHSAGSSTGDCSDQCSMWDSGTRGWLPLPPLSMKQTRPRLFSHDSRLYCTWGNTCEEGPVYTGNHTIDMLVV